MMSWVQVRIPRTNQYVEEALYDKEVEHMEEARKELMQLMAADIKL